MEVTQELISRILQRAKDSEFGCGEPENDMDLDGYAQHDSGALAMILVGAFHDKYDLVSIFKAAFEEIAA